MSHHHACCKLAVISYHYVLIKFVNCWIFLPILANLINLQFMVNGLLFCIDYAHYNFLCRVRKARNVEQLSKSCDDIFGKLIQSGIPPKQLYDTVCKQVLFYIVVFKSAMHHQTFQLTLDLFFLCVCRRLKLFWQLIPPK